MKFSYKIPAARWLVLGYLLTAGALHGAVTYSGVVDIPIPTSFNGVYLDLAAGTPSTPSNDSDAVNFDSFTQGYSEPADWDVNFFFGGIGIAYSDTFSPFVDDTPSASSRIINVATGTDIQSEAASRALGINQSYGGSGTADNTGNSHFVIPSVDSDPKYSAFTPGQEGYIAFVLDVSGSAQYGWMRVTLDDDGPNSGNVGTIHDWAFSDDAGFTVGQIPEPSSLLLLLLGSLGLLRRKR